MRERERTAPWSYGQGDPLCSLQIKPIPHNLSAGTLITDQDICKQNRSKKKINLGKIIEKGKINQVKNHALSSSDLQVSVLAASRIQKLSLKARTFSTTSF